MRMAGTVRLISVGVALAVAGAASAQTTHYVDLEGHCDGAAPCHATIMAAVGASAGGDTVAVFPGAYDEAVEVDGHPGLVLKAHAVGATALTCSVRPRPKRAELRGPVKFLNMTDIRVEGLVFADRFDAGVALDGFEIVGNTFRGLFMVGSCMRSLIRHNHMAGGVSIEHARGCRVHDNVFADNPFARIGSNSSRGNLVTDNFFVASSLRMNDDHMRDNEILRNRINDGSIVVTGRFDTDDVLIQGNVIRGGGIVFGDMSGSSRSRILDNQVFDSDGDGIYVELSPGSSLEVIGNTALGHAGCDLNDQSFPTTDTIDVTWADNEFDTACGAADG